MTKHPFLPGLALLALLPALAACEGDVEEPAPQAQQLIAEVQSAHGSGRLDSTVVEFGFRGTHFTVRRDSTGFRYERTYRADSTGARVREVLTPDSLYRTVGGTCVDLSPEERRGLETVLNSVVYFALLPEALTDPAVQPRSLGRDTVQGIAYHEVEVTFQKEGGGRDWEDRFVYWMHPERHTVDYLAYYFHTGEGGARFRKAVNPRTVGGARFQDYLNYRAAADTLRPDEIDHFDDLMQSGRLEKVSEVRLDSVQLAPLDGPARRASGPPTVN